MRFTCPGSTGQKRILVKLNDAEKGNGLPATQAFPLHDQCDDAVACGVVGSIETPEVGGCSRPGNDIPDVGWEVVGECAHGGSSAAPCRRSSIYEG